MLGLIVREPFVSRILDGKKIWEIRSRNTNVRGRIGLIHAGSGLVVGTVKLIDSFRWGERAFVWVLASPRRYRRPRPYNHPNGAVIWVRLMTKSA